MSTEDIIQDSTDELRALLGEADKLLANAGDAADESVKELRDRVRAALDKGRSQIERVQISAREHLGECDEYIRTHPYQSLGAAALVGALTALLLCRRG